MVNIVVFSRSSSRQISFSMFKYNLIKLLTVIGLFLAINAQQPGWHWNYDNVKGWTEHASACGGTHQSPINIKTSKCQDVQYSRIHFGKYKKVLPEIVINNGHTVKFSVGQISASKLPYIRGGGLNDRYIFEHMHFHWGADSNRGSEHTIDGKAFPAELHMVHYNSKYGSFNQSLPYPDGLAVLGILIQLKDQDNAVFRHLEQFDRIRNANPEKFEYLTYPVPLWNLLPANTGKFFRYNGSLTTPACNEDVIWTVFEEPIYISEAQLRAFRELRDEEGKSLIQNHRPVQELYDRKVTRRIHN